MIRVNLKEAEGHLAHLIEEAAAGQEVVITSSGGSIVRLVPMREGERAAEASGRRADRTAAADPSPRLKAAVAAHPAFEAEILSLALLDDSALWNAAQTRMPQSDSERMEDLHRKQRLTGLSKAEAQELSRLEQQYDRVILVRSHSASLLEHRGHDIRRLTSQESHRLAPGG